MYLKRVKKRKGKKRKRTIFDNQVLDLSPEIKQIDSQAVITSFTAASGPPLAIQLNGIATGEGYYNRLGAKIEMQSLRITGYIDPYQTAPGLPSYLRMVIVYDRQANGALPGYTDVFRSVFNSGGEESSGMSQLSHVNSSRFKIVYDKVIYGTGYTTVLMEGNNTTGPEGRNEFLLDLYVPLKGLQTIYKGTSANYTDITSGGLTIFFIDNNETNKRRAHWTARLRYKDC